MIYRPWGDLSWSLGLSAKKAWAFVGALGTEDRCLAAYKLLSGKIDFKNVSLLQIADEESRFSARTELKLKQNRDRFTAYGGQADQIKEFELFAELYKIQSVGVDAADSSVLLDITSLPKRFFFPLVRAFYMDKGVKDLLICYSSAERYASEPLAEKFGPWTHLPGFIAREETRELLIVGVGFMVESLQQYLSSMVKHDAVRMLIPFPAPLAAVRRSWEAAFNLENPRDPAKFANFRVSAFDLSAAFDRIENLTRNCASLPAFAPFGPKPMSAAMCLYAIQTGSPVYYPQPHVYHPNYSEGVGSTNAYWLKHEGNGLYDLAL